jgi:hypothetical protein
MPGQPDHVHAISPEIKTQGFKRYVLLFSVYHPYLQLNVVLQGIPQGGEKPAQNNKQRDKRDTIKILKVKDTTK